MIDVSVFIQHMNPKRVPDDAQAVVERYEDGIRIADLWCNIEEGDHGYYLYVPYNHHWIWDRIKREVGDIQRELSGVVAWYNVACPEFETKLDLIMFIERVLPLLEQYIREVRL